MGRNKEGRELVSHDLICRRKNLAHAPESGYASKVPCSSMAGKNWTLENPLGRQLHLGDGI